MQLHQVLSAGGRRVEPGKPGICHNLDDGEMILSGDEIRKNLGSNIKIDPFRTDLLNPNSYNLTLHDELMVYEEVVLDMKKPNRVRRFTIPEEGIVLSPNQLYLGRTVEHTETRNLVPMIEARSSVARLGLSVNVTAGFGDVGYCGCWTLEMFALQPVRIYPGVPICQILFHEICGEILDYSSKYQNADDIQPSLIHRELNPNAEADEMQMRLPFVKTRHSAIRSVRAN